MYRYYSSADEVVLAVADELIGKALSGWCPTGSWRVDLSELGRRMHAVAVAHPRAATLSAYRVTGRVHEIEAVELILAIFRGAGFPDDEAVLMYRTFVDQALALGALDAANSLLSESAQKAQAEIWRSTYGSVSAESHPNIAKTAPHLVSSMQESSYPLSLELLLSAIASRLENHS